jgi:hypothetical protein
MGIIRLKGCFLDIVAECPERRYVLCIHSTIDKREIFISCETESILQEWKKAIEDGKTTYRLFRPFVCSDERMDKKSD